MGLSRMSSSQDQSLHAFDVELGAHGGGSVTTAGCVHTSYANNLDGAGHRGML
jgi:hypothetical protein